MTDERLAVDELAEGYLEGELSPAEAAAFERDLATRPEVAEALSAAILLRDLLGRMPPEAPPAGLEERIAGSLGLDARPAQGLAPRHDAGERPSRSSGVLAALSGTSWLVRPSAVLVTGGMGGARPIAAGFGQLRWFLGPLAARHAEAAPAQPTWRRVVRGLGRLGGLG